jgi:hypothetical protein
MIHAVRVPGGKVKTRFCSANVAIVRPGIFIPGFFTYLAVWVGAIKT